MLFKDYYKILGFETNRVSEEQIKNAFREQAKKYHPDRNDGTQSAEERFKDINEAYRILGNPATKRKYDRSWNRNIGKDKNKERNAGNMKSSDTIIGEAINMFFGSKKEKKQEPKIKNKKPSIKGENIETGINVSIEEAFFGASKKISLRAVDGSMKTFTVKIPAGIRNGEKIRLIGQGKKGENGGKNGDLFIKINIEKDKKFNLEGCNLYTYLDLTPWEAALGTRKKVEGIDGAEMVYIPKGIQTGEKIKIQGRGYKDSKGGRGELVAEIRIMVPKKPTEAELKLYEELKKLAM
ncbi:MAG: DnaJ domain-containing protein [Clostridia bacterium]|nr:DnaJ domain-containing protein [Clostridia bacterium]